MRPFSALSLLVLLQGCQGQRPCVQGSSEDSEDREDEDQCLLSKAAVRSVRSRDMLAQQAHARSHELGHHQRHTSGQGADILDSIPWHQQLKDYQKVADDVAPTGHKTSRCPLRRVDAQSKEAQKLKDSNEPLIFTNVFDTSADWLDDFKKDALLDEFGDVKLFDDAFDHLGAGSFMRDHLDDIDTVEDATEAKQPGNLIFFEGEVGGKMVEELLERVRPNVASVALPEDTDDTWENRGISFGHQGQWNQMHIHNRFIFTQLLGSKGWVMSPAKTFPESAEDRHNVIPLTHPAMCSPFFKKSQKHSYAPLRLAETSDFQKNQTDAGVECVLHAGEALYVPGHEFLQSWWHGTCDLDKWNAGATTIFHKKGSLLSTRARLHHRRGL